MDFIHVLDSLAICIQTKTPALLEGPVGDGKTTIIEGMAKGLGCEAQYTSIVALHDPPEYGGYQVPQEPIRDAEGRVVKPAVVSQVPLEWVYRLSKAKRPLLFLDEFSNGAPATRAATMRGVLDGYWGDAHIPNLAVVVAMNPPEIAESGYELSAPLSNRFCHLPWDMPVEYWNAAHIGGFKLPDFGQPLPSDWEKHMPWARTLVSAFANARPAAIKAMPASAAARSKPFPTLRSWTVAERLLAACRALGYGVGQTSRSGSVAIAPHDVVTALVAGCVGGGAAGEFIQYCAALDLPDPEDLLRDPKSLKLPARGDQAFAVLTAVVSAVIAQLTVPRWQAAWDVLGQAAKAQRADVAAACARALVDCRPKDAKSPAAIDHFLPLLKAAGLLRP